ncbi:MAG: hypothetical protein MJ252_29925 [archaeon]|nr:hypothetical protein [archaeon]
MGSHPFTMTLINSEFLNKCLIPQYMAHYTELNSQEEAYTLFHVVAEKLVMIKGPSNSQQELISLLCQIFLNSQFYNDTLLLKYALSGLENFSNVINPTVIQFLRNNDLFQKISTFQYNIFEDDTLQIVIKLIGNYLYQEETVESNLAENLTSFLMNECNLLQSNLMKRNCLWALSNLCALSKESSLKLLEQENMISLLNYLKESEIKVAKEALICIINMFYFNESDCVMVNKIMEFNTFDFLIFSFDKFSNSIECKTFLLQGLLCLFRVGEKLKELTEGNENIYVQGFLTKGGEEILIKLNETYNPIITEFVSEIETFLPNQNM